MLYSLLKLQKTKIFFCQVSNKKVLNSLSALINKDKKLQKVNVNIKVTFFDLQWPLRSYLNKLNVCVFIMLAFIKVFFYINRKARWKDLKTYVLKNRRREISKFSFIELFNDRVKIFNVSGLRCRVREMHSR